jgi:hypothetical protein
MQMYWKRTHFMAGASIANDVKFGFDSMAATSACALAQQPPDGSTWQAGRGKSDRPGRRDIIGSAIAAVRRF